MVWSGALFLMPHGLWNQSSSVLQLPFLLAHLVWPLHILWVSSPYFLLCSGSNKVVERSIRLAALPLHPLLLAYLEVEELFHLPGCQKAAIRSPLYCQSLTGSLIFLFAWSSFWEKSSGFLLYLSFSSHDSILQNNEIFFFCLSPVRLVLSKDRRLFMSQFFWFYSAVSGRFFFWTLMRDANAWSFSAKCYNKEHLYWFGRKISSLCL